MEKLNAKHLIQDARQKLEGKNANRLAAFHTGITVAAALVITALQYILAEGIGKTSGLSGLGTRSILETIQTVLQWVNTILVPFWSLGFLYAALQWAKGNHAHREDLLTGFRRVGPYIGLTLNRTFLTIAVMVITVNISSMIYMMTPAAIPLIELVEIAGADANALSQMMLQMPWEDTMELANSLLPMLILWGILCLVLLVPLMYRFRMAEYVILDNPMARGLSSMLLSASLLRRRCWQLFKLDLKLWWYYGLKFLCAILCYGDILLDSFGVELPIGADGAYFLSYGLYLAALFAVEAAFRPRVDTAYACAYSKLVELGPAARKTHISKPQDLPWDAE